MPVEATIALSGKPPVIAPFNVNETFLTLGRLKYLAAETGKVQEEAARAQQLFQEQGAAGNYLSSLRTPAAPPPTPPGPLPGGLPGGPPFDEATLQALPQGGSMPPLGGTTPPGPAQGPGAALPSPSQGQAPDILHPDVHAELFRLAPHAAPALLKEALDIKTTGQKLAIEQLGFAAQKVEQAARTLPLVTDDASLQAWKLANSTFLPPQVVAMLPQSYTPAALTKLTQSAQALATQFEQQIAQQKSTNETTTAESGRILAHAETVKAGAAQVQARAAESQAETNRRLQERPYTMGPGYGLDPRSPQPKTLGPSGQATQAPRSPEGQAAYNTLSSEFNTQSQVFGEATAAYNKIVPLARDKTNTSDITLLRGFNKLTEPGQAIGVFAGKQTEALGNLPEQISGELSRLLSDKGAVIAEPLRQKIVATAKKIHALQIDQHLQLRDEIRQKATNQGLPPDEVAPNRLTTYGSGGKAITQAKLKEYLADQRRKGHTRGQALLDLADNGYYVRGGPE